MKVPKYRPLATALIVFILFLGISRPVEAAGLGGVHPLTWASSVVQSLEGFFGHFFSPKRAPVSAPSSTPTPRQEARQPIIEQVPAPVTTITQLFGGGLVLVSSPYGDIYPKDGLAPALGTTLHPYSQLNLTKATIDSSGYLTIASGLTVTSFGAGIARIDGSGKVSSGVVDLGSGDIRGTVSLANGGLGATSPVGARTNIGAAASGANGDITSLSGLTTALSLAQGGTGATTLTPYGVLYGNGTSPVAALTPGTPGYLLQSNGTSAVPSWVAASGLSAGSVAFSGITGGTNTSASMLVGSGASLGFTGTGTINASTLLGNTWAAPATIGSGTPNAGAFTTLSTTSSLTVGANMLLNTNGAVIQGKDTAGSSLSLLAVGSDNTLRVGWQTAPTTNGHLILYAAGAEGARINPSGSFQLAKGLVWGTDNTFDIGNAGANRARDLYLGRNALLGGTLSLTGFAQGSIPYIGAGGALAQDNANLNWDATNHLLSVGSGDNEYLYAVGQTARQLKIFDGTAASPITASTPTFKVARTEAITRATIEAVGGVGTDGSDQLAAIMGISRGLASTEVQSVGLMGVAESSSTSTLAGHDAAGVYGVGRITGGGTGTGIGAFFIARRDNDSAAADAMELHVANYGTVNAAWNPSGFSKLTGLWMNAGGNADSSVAVAVSNAFGRQFDVGLGFTNQATGGKTGGVITAAIRDESSATTSYVINGSHTYGIDMAGATAMTGAALRTKVGHAVLIGTNASVDSVLDITAPPVAGGGLTRGLTVRGGGDIVAVFRGGTGQSIGYFSNTDLVMNTGNILFQADNTKDIGASGGSRARDLYLARNAVIGGTASVSGVLTIGNGTTNAIQPAYGPLQLQYKSGADAWTTGITLQDMTGNVGIGTTTPAKQLDVTGDIHTTGNLYADAGMLNVGSAYTAFGDSITLGGGASTNANKYTNIIAAQKNWTLTNLGVSGYVVEQMVGAMYNQTVTTSSQYTTLCCVNNMKLSSGNAGRQATFQNALYAGMAWLGIPATRKITASTTTGAAPFNLSYTGSWSNDTTYYSVGKYTTNNGATAAFTVAGSTVYLSGVRTTAGTGGSFSVSVDGTTYGSYTTYGATAIPVLGGGSTTYAPFLVRIPNLSAGKHAVVVTVTSAEGQRVDLVWAAGSAGTLQTTGPTVYLGNELRLNAAGYAANGGSDATVDTFNALIRGVARDLASDGLNVALVDVTPYYDPDNGDVNGTDLIHPTDQGHAHIANAFLSAMNSIVYARDRQNAAFAQGVIPSLSLGENTARSGIVRLPSLADIVWRMGDNSADGVSLAETATNDLSIMGGNVGIGTTAPVNKLSVAGSVAIGTYAGVATAPANGLLVSGNVGIGTTSPRAAFDVTGGASLSANLSLRGSGTHTLSLLDGGSLAIQRSVGGDAGLATAITVDPSGHLLVGATAQASASTTELTAFTGETALNVRGSGSSNVAVFRNSGGSSIAFFSASDFVMNGGNILFQTDNTKDIGSSGASRPRNLNLASNAVIGGTASISGVLTVGNGTTNTLQSAYGPLQLAYKSGANAWTTGITLQDTTGNVGIGQTNPTLGPLQMASGAYVTSGGVWANASDRNLKTNFTPLDPQVVLSKIDTLPVTEWNYKSEDAGIKHIGPVAQDFYAAFGLGNNNTSISTIDPAGIALLGIQALDQKYQTLAAQAGSAQPGMTASVATQTTVDGLNTSMLSLADRVRALEKQQPAQSPVFSASLSAALQGVSLSVEKDATIAGTLAVQARTLLNDLGVTGDITTGVLAIHGLDGTIDAVGNTLKLQSLGTGSIDLLAGKVTVDASGNVVAKGEITTKKVNIDESDPASASSGKGVLKAGSTAVTIKTTAVGARSHLFITPRVKTNRVLSVTSESDGVSFTVEVVDAPATDIPFDWWIVN